MIEKKISKKIHAKTNILQTKLFKYGKVLVLIPKNHHLNKWEYMTTKSKWERIPSARLKIMSYSKAIKMSYLSYVVYTVEQVLVKSHGKMLLLYCQ